MLDAAIVELLPLQALRARAFGAGSGMQQTPRRERPWKRLGYAALLREVARRTGDATVLARAAAAADIAAGEAEGDAELRSLARLDQAETALLTHELFGEAASLASLQSFLDAAEGPGPLSVEIQLKAGLLRARLAGRRALAAGDVDALEVTIKALELLGARLPAEAGRSIQAASAANACDRGELLLGLAVRLKDRDRLKALNATLNQVAERLDADALPLSFARATALRGQVLAALGRPRRRRGADRRRHGADGVGGGGPRPTTTARSTAPATATASAAPCMRSAKPATRTDCSTMRSPPSTRRWPGSMRPAWSCARSWPMTGPRRRRGGRNGRATSTL